jgi:hypothetical protein
VAVEVLERRADGWAQIRCSNGWSAWADGRLLSLPVGPAGSGEGRPRSAAGAALSWLPNVDPFSAGGAALVLVGSFLPWLSVGPFSASAWDISLNYLLTGHGTLSGFKVGIVLVAVVVVAIPSLSGRPLPGWVVPLVGGVSLCAALAALVRGLGTAPSLDPGVGLFVTLAGGATLVVRAWLQLMAPPPV